MPAELAIPEKPRVAILASGSGTTAQRFIEGSLAGEVNAEVALLMTNNPEAGVLKRIDAFNAQGTQIRTEVVNNRLFPGPAKPGEQTEAAAREMARQLYLNGISLVLMLGFMKKIVDPLVNGTVPILNTHPGLLDKKRGLYTGGLHGIHVQEFVIEQGHAQAGPTLHLADGNYDTGRVIADHRFPVEFPRHSDPNVLFADVQLFEKAYICVDVDTFIRESLAAEFEARRQ